MPQTPQQKAIFAKLNAKGVGSFYKNSHIDDKALAFDILSHKTGKDFGNQTFDLKNFPERFQNQFVSAVQDVKLVKQKLNRMHEQERISDAIRKEAAKEEFGKLSQDKFEKMLQKVQEQHSKEFDEIKSARGLVPNTKLAELQKSHNKTSSLLSKLETERTRRSIHGKKSIVKFPARGSPEETLRISNFKEI